jgi:antitoxin HicB
MATRAKPRLGATSDYPVSLRDDEGTVLVTFPDVPSAITYGDDAAAALVHAVGALETALIGIMADRAAIPRPSKPRRGQRAVTLPALSAGKVGLDEAIRAAGVRKTEPARRLGVHAPQVDRLLDLRHASRLDQVEAALRAVGKRLVVAVRDAA